MENAMMQQMDKRQELYEAATLDAAIRQFLARWTIPDTEDSRIAREFEADFIQIVQRIYRDAQAPYLKALADAVARQPMPAMFVSEQSNQES